MDLFEAADQGAGGSNTPEYSVSELSSALKKTVEENYALVRVRGELGRVTRASSGHVYVDLKDDKAVINCNIWRPVAQGLDFKPEEGMEVIATGKLSTYAPRSGYNLIIERLEIAGEGALMALLEKRRKAFEAEGLFDASRKQELPYLPEKIGVITSRTGAVIRDILHRLEGRFPREVLLWPVAVQGKTSALEVANAVRGFNALPVGDPLRPDVIIVARGGGSIEDLWGFNEEVVVRAVAESTIPIISAVGHETDTTLIDFAADRRAPTPTAAAEFAVPVRMDLVAQLVDLETRMRRGLVKLQQNSARRLADISRALPRPETLFALPSQRLDLAISRFDGVLQKRLSLAKERFAQAAHRFHPRVFTALVAAKSQALAHAASRLEPAMRRKLEYSQALLNGQARILQAVSYTRVLERGYAMITDMDGRVLKSAAEVRKSNKVIIKQKDGETQAETKD